MGVVTSPHIETIAGAWASWMWNMTWQVVIAALALIAVEWFLRRRSAAMRYALWLVMLVRLVTPPDFAFPTGWGWWIRTSEVAVVEKTLPEVGTTSNQVQVETPVVSNGLDDYPERERLLAEQGSKGAGTADFGEEKADHLSSVNSQPGAGRQAAVDSLGEKASMAGVPWPLLLMIGWLGIAAARLGMLLTAAVQVRVWARRASRIQDARLWSMLDECRERLNVTRVVDLRNSEACATPLVVGVWQPTILLPSAVLERLDSDELRSVFIHELNHVKRWDGVVNLIQGILGAVYFFHPVVWMANNHIRKLREDACDELTVAELDGQRKPYGSAIVKVAEILGYAAPPLALGVLDSKTPARRRLERILDPQLPESSGFSWLTLVGFIALAAVLLPGGRSPAGVVKPVEIGATEVQERPADIAELPAERAGNQPRQSSNQPRQSSNQQSNNQQSSNQQSSNQQSSNQNNTFQIEQPKADESGSNPDSSNDTERVDGQRAEVATNDESSLGDLPPVGTLDDLQYGWELGRRYMYEVRVEVALGDVTEVMHGFPTFEPKSSEFGETRIGFNGRLSNSRRSSSGFPLPPNHSRISPYSPYTGLSGSGMAQNHHVVLDLRGQLIEAEGHSQLPYLLGEVSLLPIIRLPQGDESEWESKSQLVIEQPSQFPRHLGGPFASRREGIKGNVTTRYRRARDHEGTLEIHFTTEVKTEKSKRYSSSGTGVAFFDWKRGLPVKVRRVVEYKDGDQTQRMEVQCRLLTPAEMLQQDEVAEKSRRALAARRRKKLTVEQLQEIVAALLSDNDIQVSGAVQKLESVAVSDPQGEVAAGLEHVVLNDPDNKVKATVLLARWATVEEVPTLIALLDENVKTWEVMDGLKRLKDARASAVLAEKLGRGINRQRAISTLIAIGPAAEGVVLQQLDTDDYWKQRAAFEVLEAIGGAGSIEALTVLAPKVARQNEYALRRCLDKIKNRNP